MKFLYDKISRKFCLIPLSNIFCEQKVLFAFYSSNFHSWSAKNENLINMLSNEKRNFCIYKSLQCEWMGTARCKRLRKTCRSLQSASEDLRLLISAILTCKSFFRMSSFACASHLITQAREKMVYCEAVHESKDWKTVSATNATFSFVTSFV